ncbi:hypothetical protein LCGC14_1642830 [marine sediment metagenome]|uniref:Uncharacterized protein n=1 Tax=marine sediment metagenome TaxID=412755 RepID=A0A0F9ILM2_9ZZZZ
MIDKPRICLCGGYIGSHDKKNETCSHLGRNKKGDSYGYVCLCSRYEGVSDDVHNVHYAPIPDGVIPDYRDDVETSTTEITQQLNVCPNCGYEWNEEIARIKNES